MQISKYLCVMIIGAIVITTSASPLRKKRSCKDNSGQQPSGSSGPTYYVNNQQSNTTSTTNQCSAGNQYCCNNVANSNNAQLQNGNSDEAGSIFYHKQTNQQLACSNYNSGSGSQQTGCTTNMYCCQGNSGYSVINFSCSPITLDLSSITGFRR
ncbi:unnamed protein product [Adineta steineri]|uniref:Hydrophobin n=1 Tax=Adineta steineri TaxID=433720 RepID=A0A814V859_9BILA|nr:unnamed protein product [Adineta steineri]CAF4249481.1 unnamed protein product [Adineta steineri]